MSAGTAGPEDRALLQLVVDAALDAVIVMDAGGLVVHWNKQAEVIFGWTRAEALGQPLAALVIPPRYRAAHTEGLRRFLETGQGPVLNRRVELVAARRDGRELPVELVLVSHGEPVLGGGRDAITRALETEGPSRGVTHGA